MAMFRWREGWDPLIGLRVMQREMERLMGRGYGDSQHIGGGNYPPINVLSSAEEVIVQCEVPGVSKEDLDLSITGETLVVKGVKKSPADEDKLHYPRRERGVGEFTRTVVLPDKVDPDKIEATLSNGILTVTLPKSEAALPRQISVK